MTGMREAHGRRYISTAGVPIDPERLRRYRQDRGWSPADLAAAVNALGWTEDDGRPLTITRDGVSKNEDRDPRRRRSPRKITLLAYAQALSSMRKLLRPAGNGQPGTWVFVPFPEGTLAIRPVDLLAGRPPSFATATLADLRRPPADLGLPREACDILASEGITTIGALTGQTEQALRDILGPGLAGDAVIRLGAVGLAPREPSEAIPA